jgi:tungsten cofactor oxidoreducase radical SAM maturase
MKYIVGQNGSLNVAKNSPLTRPLPPGTECFIERKDGVMIVLPRLPDLRKLYIEPTTACNLNCHTCVRNSWDDPDAQMDIQLFRNLMSQTKILPDLRSVIISGIGEPLTHPEIIEMVRMAKARKLHVTLSSNGLLLDREVSLQLVELGLDRLVVSIDGVEPETFSGIRGTEIEEVLENLRTLKNVKSELSSLMPSLEIEFVALKRNVQELGSLSRLASELAVTRILISNVLPHTEEMRQEVLYGYEPTRPLSLRSWPVRLDAWVLWGTPDLPRMHWGAEQRCRFVQDKAAVIGWDGAVSPCLALAHSYSYYAVDGKLKKVSRYTHGNITEDNIAGDTEGTALLDIWTSEEYLRFRNEVSSFNFPSCPDCDLRETCDLRERNEGCWGWNPSCADCLYAQDIVRCPGGGR